jgi:hypothetical protein
MTNRARANYAIPRLDYPAALRRMFKPGHKLARTNNAKRAGYEIIPGGEVSEAVAKRIIGHTLCREDDRGLFAETSQSWSFRTDTVREAHERNDEAG